MNSVSHPSYTVISPDDYDVAREIFLSGLFTGKQSHFGSAGYRTKMGARKLLGLHGAYDVKFTSDNYGNEAVIAAVRFRGTEHQILVLRNGERDHLRVSIITPSHESMVAHLNWLDGKVPAIKQKKVKNDNILVNFLFRDPMRGATARQREISAPRWEEIAGNYSKSVAPQLESLTTVKLEDLNGHFGVFLGPPGTGKTHYLRALMQGWRKQANFIYVIDPEDLFNNAQYMVQVLFDTADSESWNVIICEDAEEFIAPTAKADVGQALSRLLNLGDGLLGQGLRVIFLFTTNADLDELHPAMVRPGRCFDNMHIPLLTEAEASDWLGSPVKGDASLAELYNMRRENP